MRKDLVYAVRALLKNPAFAALALVSLALGIGANTAIFSVINATLLHPVPYPDPSRLVLIYTKVPKSDLKDFPVSAPDFTDWRSRNSVFRFDGRNAHSVCKCYPAGRGPTVFSPPV